MFSVTLLHYNDVIMTTTALMRKEDIWCRIKEPSILSHALSILPVPRLSYLWAVLRIYTKVRHLLLNKASNKEVLLTLRRLDFNFKYVIYKFISGFVIVIMYREITCGLMPQDISVDQSILVKLMICCLQATSHYLDQCGVSSTSWFGLIIPCCVK